jgi:hypothetical protein
MDRICPAVVSQRNLTLGWNQHLSREERFSSVRFASCPLGTLTTLRSRVRILVDRKPTSSIVPRVSPIFRKVSHSHNPVEDDGDSTQDVLQSLLGGEGDGNSADTECWQDGGGVKTEAVQGNQQSGEKGQQLDRPAAQTND